MSNLVEVKNNTHIVIKREDAEKYLSPKQKKQLQKLKITIARRRLDDGKKVNNYYICNIDEPYAGEVIATILRGEILKK